MAGPTAYNEKDSLYSALEEPRSGRRRRSGTHPFMVALTAVLLYQCSLSIYGHLPGLFPSRRFRWTEISPVLTSSPEKTGTHKTRLPDWDEIKPSKNLHFHDCGNGHKCAKLQVPLDYWNGTQPDQTVTLPLIMLPAKVPVNDPRYAGPILLNPGGPGGSGVDLAFAYGRSIQLLVDSAVVPERTTVFEKSSERFYDIVGFDPRGVGHSEPLIRCFSSAAERGAWGLRQTTVGILGSSDATSHRQWSMLHAFGHACAESSRGSADIMRYATTAYVARDMLQMVEKLGKWREKKARKILDLVPGTPAPEHLRYKPGEEKLQYWGFSYGSFLGYTFASMFPDRVSRVIVDGVVDSDDYTSGQWQNSMNDTEKTMNWFYRTCASAGPDVCRIAESSKDTAKDIEARVRAILKSTYEFPYVVPGSIPEVIPWSDLKMYIFLQLYTPIPGFAQIGKVLAAMRDGDQDVLLETFREFHQTPCSSDDSAYRSPGSAGEASTAIACSDAVSRTDVTFDEFEKSWPQLVNKSPTGGPYWGLISLACTGWKIRPQHSFRGPFGGKTKTPVLFIGNEADTVTPYSAAKKMAARFPGSGLLKQNSPGHCSLSAYSSCTTQTIRAYMHNGTIPEAGKVCEVEQTPFGTFGNNMTALGVELGADEVMRFNAHRDLAQHVYGNRLGMGMRPFGI